MILFNYFRKNIVTHILVLLLLVPFFTFAQEKGLVKCGATIDDACTIADFFVLIKDVMNWGFRIGVAISSIMFAYAGFLVMTSLGRPGQISKAKNIFLSSAIGIIIMFTAYGVVYFILTKLGVTEGFNQFLTN